MSNFELKIGSSVDEEVDAIVNAANKYLLAGGGVCGAIFKKAGLEVLQEACNKYSLPLNDGDAVITDSFGVHNAKAIIHAVGPDFRETPNAFDILCTSYYNSLLVLMNNNLHSISFPLISSGIFAGNTERPAYESTKRAVLAYNKFISDYPDYEVDVRIFAFLEETYYECREAVDEYLVSKRK